MNHKSLVVCDHYPTRTNEVATKTTTSTGSLHLLGRQRPTRCRLVAYLLFIYTSATLQAAVAYAQESSERDSGAASNRSTENDHNDGLLFYTRLRYDQNYLPIYKNLQKQFPYEETRLQLGLLHDHTNDNDDDDDDDDVNRQVVEYYVNPNISLHDLTQNDLILEALDQVYRSRLLQSYEFTYDNPEDRRRAADPRKVNKKRCHRELDYLLSKLKPAAASRHNRKWPLMGGISPELAAFFDSYATEEAGVLLGNVFWLGNWQQCQKRHIFDPHNRVNFKGRYCVASIGAAEWAEKIEQKIAHLKRIDYFKFTNQEHNYRRSFRIQLGICLPESCDSTIVDSSSQRRDDIQLLSLLRLGPPYDSYNLTDLYCLPDESSPLRQIPASGRLLIGLSLVWFLLLLVSTYADAHDLVGLGAVVKQKSRKSFLQKIVISYSLIRNYQHLVQSCRRPASTPDKQTLVFEAGESKQNGFEKANGSKKKEDIVKLQQEPHVSDLQFFDAFKVLATAIILGGHIGMIILRFAQYSLDFFTIPPGYFHFIASTAFYVDWFFCMTGFITAYANFASRSVYTNTRIHWLYSVFHRYWRLAPIYLLTFWFCRSLFQYTSHGPLWDYGTSNASLRAICQQESWLAPLTLTSNWHPLHRECIMPAWYIANDMQFYLITPFLLLALAYRPRLAWMSALGMSLASVLARAERYYWDSHAQHLELMHPRFDLVMRNNWDLHRIYLWPHYRISPYLIGLLAGHYAFMVKSGRWSSPLAAAATERRQPEEATANESAASNSNGFQKVTHPEKKTPTTDWRRNRTILAWTGLYVTCTVSMTSYLLDTSFPRRLEPFARPIVAVVYALGHSIAGAGVAALFVALLLGQWPRVRALMELAAWSKLAKINYFVYLFQVEIITWASQAQNKLPEVSLFEQLKLLALLGPLLYALAWLVTLLVANPLAKLEIEFVGVYARPSAATSGPSARAEREKQRRQCGGSAGCEQVTCTRNGTTTAGRAVEVFDRSAAGAGLAVKQAAPRCRQQAAANRSC